VCHIARNGVITRSALKQLNADYFEKQLPQISDPAVREYVTALLDAHYGRVDTMPDSDVIFSEVKDESLILRSYNFKEEWMLKGANLTIQRKKTSNIIPLACIVDVKHSPPRGFNRGVITITTTKPASMGVGIGLTSNISIAAGDNIAASIVYDPADLGTAEKIISYITGFMDQRFSPPPQSEAKEPPNNPLDDILKLKQLLDVGAINEEEFKTLKEKLINSL